MFMEMVLEVYVGGDGDDFIAVFHFVLAATSLIIE